MKRLHASVATFALVAWGACDYDAKVPKTARCEDLSSTFERDVLEPILSHGCIVCHRDGGLAGHTDLRLVAGDDDQARAYDLAVVGAVAQKTVNGESVLLLRPTGRHPDGHTGGAPIDPDSAAYRALARFVAAAKGCRFDPPAGIGMCATDGGAATGPRLVRRLSRYDWAASIEALLGVEADPAALAPDDVQHGFDNQADALEVTPLLADQWRGEAERLARAAWEKPFGNRPPWLRVCQLRDAGCPTRFIRELGLRAFRRPPSDEEVATYLGLFEDVRAEDGEDEAAIWVLTAVLQSPSFLYRSELGVRGADGTFTLTGWEVATALSFAVWGAPPDETGLARAAAGDLSRASGIETELTRLLADPRADATLVEFGERWMGTNRLPFVTRDQTTYPELTNDIRRDMAGEAARFLVFIAAGDGRPGDLLTTRSGFMTDALADFYGLPRPTGERDPAGFAKIDLSATHYGGLLRLGALLTTHALPQSSSPIHRGKWVRERLLCEDLPPPPANLDTSPPPMDPTKSTRERYAEHASLAACKTCHEKIDPIGFGLEHFDGIGRWREKDGPHLIDDRGVVVGLADGSNEFEGPDELASVLDESGELDRCWLLQRARYALGYDPPACLVDEIQSRFAERGGRLAETLAAIFGTHAFVLRRGSAGEGETLAVGTWDFGNPPDDPVDPVVPGDNTPGGPAVPGGPTPIGDIRIEANETSRWGEGYCFQVSVTNVGAALSGWEVVREVEGAIDNLWNARSEPASEPGQLRFTGVDWNATLHPGASTTFGWCAKL